MRRALKVIDAISEWSGKVVSFLVIVFTLVILYEVVARYLFDSPTNWTFEVSLAFYGAYIVLIGAYVLRVGQHVNVEILYGRFPPRVRAAVDLFTWCLFFLWVGSMIWEGWQSGWHSLLVREREPTSFGCPVYPVKLCIPVGAFLLFLQGLADYVRNAVLAVTGREP